MFFLAKTLYNRLSPTTMIIFKILKHLILQYNIQICALFLTKSKVTLTFFLKINGLKIDFKILHFEKNRITTLVLVKIILKNGFH